MASLTVNPTNYNITDVNTNTVKIYFNTDVTLNDIKLSTNNGQSFINNINMSQSSASFDISHLDNNNYTCLLKGVYEEIESGGGTTNYYITNNLTNCTNSNTSSSISSGSSYSATISANSGYTMNTITVTMGGTNITNSAVSGNNIYISNVTGDIVITANATQQSSGGGVSGGNGITTSKSSYSIAPGTENLVIPVTITADLSGYPVWEVRQNNIYFLYCYRDGNNINVNASWLSEGRYDNLTIAVKDYQNGQYVDLATSNTFSIIVGNSGGSDRPDEPDINVPDNRPGVDIPDNRPGVDIPDNRPGVDIPDTPVVEDALEILPSCTYLDIAEGGSKTIYFKLSNKPTSNVTINISSSSSYLTTSKNQLTFTTNNYHIAQSVNVTSIGDSNETDDTYTITVSSNSLTTKTIRVDVVDSSNGNFEVIYDNGTLVQGATLSLNNAVNNGTYISTNQNQDVSVGINGHPLNLSKNDKVHVVLGLGTNDPSSVYTMRCSVLGDGSANNISGSNMLSESAISSALSGNNQVDTYWTVANNLSNINLAFTAYFARVNIYKIYIERGK